MTRVVLDPLADGKPTPRVWVVGYALAVVALALFWVYQGYWLSGALLFILACNVAIDEHSSGRIWTEGYRAGHESFASQLDDMERVE